MKPFFSKTIRALAITALTLLAGPAQAAGPAVDIVTGPAAPKLEQLAARELAGQLQLLFEADVNITAEAKGTDRTILLGSPATNPAIKNLPRGKWPKLSAQGHLVRSVTRNGRPVLVVGGGSPVATLWAAYEVGYHFGLRTLLHADFPPMKKPDFSLLGIDIVREPNLKIRAWRVLETSPAGPESWSLADHEIRLRQLAKLKFNRVVLALHAGQPFVHFEHAGTAKQEGVLWQGKVFRVDGETAGRAAFGRDRVFGNPDFQGATTYEARVKAGVRLITGIISAAHDLGMTVALQISPDEFPQPFALRSPKATAKKRALANAQLAAYRKTYPDVDAWILQPTKSGGRVLASSNRPESKKAMDRCELIFLGSPTGGVLPEFDTDRLHQAVERARGQKLDGFVAASWLPDDLNSSSHYLSRAAFDAFMTPARALDELVTPICGPGVGARIAIGFQKVAEASRAIAKNDASIAILAPDVVLRHYASADPVPAWWATTKTSFIEAMNEMYRGNTRARGGARAFSLYHAKRFEFALHYFTCLEETRQAGIARAAKDQDGQLEHLDLAVAAMHSALGAMADVDRNNGDRGVIAALNEYGFRPLLRELERAEQ